MGKQFIHLMEKKTFTRYTIFNPAGEIVHIKNFEQGSDLGLSPIEAGSEAIGSALHKMSFWISSLRMVQFLVLLKWIQLHQKNN